MDGRADRPTGKQDVESATKNIIHGIWTNQTKLVNAKKRPILRRRFFFGGGFQQCLILQERENMVTCEKNNCTHRVFMKIFNTNLAVVVRGYVAYVNES